MSETSLCRSRLSRYCLGMGLDIGYGGDPIVPSAITLDQQDRYSHVGDHPQHLTGDARSLKWFQDGVLDYVYSSHLLEDFQEHEIVVMLWEWLRVLKRGGLVVLYLPDQRRYVDFCRLNGSEPNPNHKIPNFGLTFMKNLLSSHFFLDSKGNGVAIKVIHTLDPAERYSFDLVLVKEG